jgi:hypothetical protein
LGSRTIAIHYFDHPNNIWHSISIFSLDSKYLNIQTKILAFNLNVNILEYWHLIKYTAKPPNANIQTETINLLFIYPLELGEYKNIKLLQFL